MTIQDWLSIGFFLLATLNVVQFIINRRDKRRDIAKEKKFQIYSDFMRKLDEQSEKLRNSQGNLIGEVFNFGKIYFRFRTIYKRLGTKRLFFKI